MQYPSGPRGDGMQHASGPPVFRGSANSTSTTYPRTQTFKNPRGANGTNGDKQQQQQQQQHQQQHQQHQQHHHQQQQQRKPPPSAADVYLGDLPAFEPDGRRHQAIAGAEAAAIEAKLRRLEEESGRLRLIIAEKQRAKRAGLREWSKLQADTNGARARAEGAEETARRLNREKKEAVGSSAF
jgi:hypothetical protein